MNNNSFGYLLLGLFSLLFLVFSLLHIQDKNKISKENKIFLEHIEVQEEKIKEQEEVIKELQKTLSNKEEERGEINE